MKLENLNDRQLKLITNKTLTDGVIAERLGVSRRHVLRLRDKLKSQTEGTTP